MSSVLSVTQDSFASQVLQSPQPVVVDFYATWCPPCRALSPILDRLASEFDGQIRFVKINSDDEPELADRYQVTSLPTVLLLDGGEIRGQFSGLPPEAQLRQQLRQWLEQRGVSAQ